MQIGHFSHCRDSPCYGRNIFRGSLPMFPSMEIFLMRVPSELVTGDRQLLFGGVAIPRFVVAPTRQEGMAGKWPQVSGPLPSPTAALPAGWTRVDRRLSRQVSEFDFRARRQRPTGAGLWRGRPPSGEATPRPSPKPAVSFRTPRLLSAPSRASACAPGTSGHAAAGGGAARATARLCPGRRRGVRLLGVVGTKGERSRSKSSRGRRAPDGKECRLL